MQLRDNKDISSFIDKITGEVQFKEAHEEIHKEYLSHIEDAVETGMSYGLTKEAAINEALVRMGNSKKIGSDLNSIHRPIIDLTMVTSSLALCLIGIFSLNALSLSIMQAAWAVVGILICGSFIFIKPSTVLRIIPLGYPLAIVLIVAAYFGGVIFEGQPYLSFFGLSIKVVDLSAILFFLSVVGAYYSILNKTVYAGAATTVIALLPMAYYSSIQAFFPATLYFIAMLAVFVSAKINTKYLAFFTIIGIFALCMGAKNAFVQLDHLSAVQQSEAHTDFIFNQIMTNYPYLGMLVTVLFGILAVRIVVVSRELKNPFCRSLSAGCAAMFIGATTWGILSNLGYAPLPSAGLNIPFLSYGGSLLVANLALMGIVIGANRRKMLSFN